MINYWQAFWIERYSSEEMIKEWFRNFVSFYTIKPTLEKAKQEFIDGETDFIKTTIKSKKHQQKAIENLNNVVNKIKEI